MGDEENLRWRPDPGVADRREEKRPDGSDVDGTNGRFWAGFTGQTGAEDTRGLTWRGSARRLVGGTAAKSAAWSGR